MRTINWQLPPRELDATGSGSSHPASRADRTPAAVARQGECSGSAAAGANRLIRHPFVLFLAMIIQPAGAMVLTLGDRQSGGSVSARERGHD
jgi:hypothetical protein